MYTVTTTTIWKLLLVWCVFICFGQSEGNSVERCPGLGWKLYNDTKCFKLFKSYEVGSDNIASLCKQGSEGLYSANIVTINSLEEQLYLANLIHNKSTGAYIGMFRKNNKFVWSDGSSPTFTNWALGSPRNQSGLDCVEMMSGSPGIEAGKWRDVICDDKIKQVICEKIQLWSSFEAQLAIMELRNELKDSTRDVQELKEKTLKLEEENGFLRANPVPVGFIYVQLRDELPPSVTWPTVQWTDVSSNYSGLFFRVVGGDSASFGDNQSYDSSRLSYVQSLRNGEDSTLIPVEPGQWSKSIFTGSGAITRWALKFLVRNAETRPINTAMRIWKRTG